MYTVHIVPISIIYNIHITRMFNMRENFINFARNQLEDYEK